MCFSLLLRFVPLVSAFFITGCGGGGSGPVTVPSSTSTVALRSVADTWDKASPRWRDIGNNLFSSAFQTSFSYSTGRITLTYQRAPGAPYFVGHISAQGLKPNFAYQVKLAGKPVSGNRGWGTSQSFISASSDLASATPVLHSIGNTPVGGDDWTNQQLGYAGRWWDDTLAPSTNLDDAYFRANYPAHTIYGYIFLGDFVTDSSGSAEADVKSNQSFHITWQDGQSGNKQVLFNTFALAISPSSYGYDAPLGTTSQKLWYELEAGRTQPVRLPGGTYHCRLLITEEAFHGAGGTLGGVWQTVFATEDAGDESEGNDVVFSIG